MLPGSLHQNWRNTDLSRRQAVQILSSLLCLFLIIDHVLYIVRRKCMYVRKTYMHGTHLACMLNVCKFQDPPSTSLILNKWCAIVFRIVNELCSFYAFEFSKILNVNTKNVCKHTNIYLQVNVNGKIPNMRYIKSTRMETRFFTFLVTQ